MRHSEVDVSIIVVSYNSAHVIKKCIESIVASVARASVSYDITVVDNDGRDNLSDLLANTSPFLHIMGVSENKGFAAAVNVGISHATGRYLFILNPDTIVLEDAIASLVSFMETHQRAGVVGCQMLAPDGSAEVSFVTGLLSKPITAELATRDVYAISGAAMMFRSQCLGECGGLDESFFFAGEDVDVCVQARSLGWEVWFTPDARIIHIGAQSHVRPDLRRDARIMYHRRKGELLLLTRYGSRMRQCGWRVFNLLYSIIAFVIISAVLPISCINKRRRENTIATLRGFVMVSGLALTRLPVTRRDKGHAVSVGEHQR